MTDERGQHDSTRRAVGGPVARSRTLLECFDRKMDDLGVGEILAVAILHERDVAPFVDVEVAQPFDDGAQPRSEAQARTLASMIVPQYQPALIPQSAGLTPRTRCVSRAFAPNESLAPRLVNMTLATMLAELLDDDEVGSCWAISLTGDSAVLGQTRFAVVAKVDTATKGDAVLEMMRASDAGKAENLKQEGWLKRLQRRLGGGRSGVPSDKAAGKQGSKSSPSPETELIARLEAIGDPGLDPYSFGLLCQELAEARATGAVPRLLALMRLRNRGALSGGSGGPREEAIKALGTIGDPSAIDVLAAELNDGVKGTAALAASALAKIGGPGALEALIGAMRSDSAVVRSAAVKALGESGDPSAADAVRGLVNDSNTDVQRAVRLALHRLEPDAPTPVHPTSSDTSVATTWHAEHAGPERSALCDEGELSERDLPSFTVLRIVSPPEALIDRTSTVAVRGRLTCVCGFESPVDIEVGLRGFMDAPSKQSVPCPRCNGLTLVVGATTGKADDDQLHWLLITQQTGSPGAVVMPGSSRLPELSVVDLEVRG